MLAHQQREELLVLAKTYPHPSTKYRETTCVAALTREGKMKRIFPVPFRLLSGEQKFAKWEWLSAVTSKAANDHRPESYRISVDTIERVGETVSTQKEWRAPREWLEPHSVSDFAELEARRQASGQTLGVVQVASLLGLDISPLSSKDANWSDKERAHLNEEVLFDSEEACRRPPLRKLPFHFHYRYRCEANGISTDYKHMLTDWEVGALYWNCIRSHGSNWEAPFRQKLEADMSEKQLMLLMGTIHRFPDQWLVIGLIYPPKAEPDSQIELNFD